MFGDILDTYIPTIVSNDSEKVGVISPLGSWKIPSKLEKMGSKQITWC